MRVLEVPAWSTADHPGRTHPNSVRVRLIDREGNFVDGEIFCGDHLPRSVRRQDRVYGFRVVIDRCGLEIGVYEVCEEAAALPPASGDPQIDGEAVFWLVKEGA